jgi:ribosomal protein S18 acetylase RimI-like enzyme
MTGLLVRPADPAEFDAIARLTVAAYEADGQLDGEHGYERVLADVPARAGAGEVLVAVDIGRQRAERSGAGGQAAGIQPLGRQRAERGGARGQAAGIQRHAATDEVVGSVTFVLPGTAYAELSAPGEAEFRMLAVDPAAQGRGVGEALARACVARAVELGCRAVVICTRSFSAPAHRLYARLGFVRTPERDWSPVAGVELLALRLELTDQVSTVAPAPTLSSSS